jgi:hypothetical protein
MSICQTDLMPSPHLAQGWFSTRAKPGGGSRPCSGWFQRIRPPRDDWPDRMFTWADSSSNPPCAGHGGCGRALRGGQNDPARHRR